MDKMHLVCVVMPVYNGAKTIELAIRSLLYQTYTSWNCVIVNDGSTDDTKDILDKINDNRFKIIHLEKNKGRGYARQVALDNAKGEYVAFLDADDFYHYDKLRVQTDILNANYSLSLVSSVAGVYDQYFVLRRIRRSKSQGEYCLVSGDDINFLPATTMIRLNEACNFEYNAKLNASEDLDFFSKYLLGKKYYMLTDVMYYYSEYESVTYRKVIAYSFHNLKRILSTHNNVSTFSFLKNVSTVLFKLIIYVFLYPILGKSYFLNKRGFNATDLEIKVFDDCLLRLNRQ